MLMAGIPPQNIIQLRDASYKDMEDLPDKVKEKIMPLTSDLKDPTGICGEQGYIKGIYWHRAKILATKEDSP